MNLRASPQLGPWSSGQLECAVFVVKIQDGTGLYRVSWINLCTTGFLSVFKPDVSPTYTPKTATLRACDIISPSSQGFASDICYEKQHINRLKIVRYSYYIPW